MLVRLVTVKNTSGFSMVSTAIMAMTTTMMP
jgi:hypothetical protein